MHLYALTLQKASSINHAILGNFSGSKQQEIVISRGKIIEILRPDPNTGKVFPLLAMEMFGVIRDLIAFKLTGGSKDYVVVGSDSGRIVILEYIPSKNTFEKVHQETFGKSGCRRIVPGQYLAVDPKGRAIMIGAVEKQKLVYILNRDAAARLTISSPLEAHKSHTLVYHVVGVDVGFENPMFACLEMDYEDADSDPTGEAVHTTQQTLTFYELDLGLNHVVRKYSEPLEEHGNLLISVPGGNDGPSGVLVCSENYITYKNFGDQADIRMPIPRRKSMFFFLLQTEQGDIFKITLEVDEDMVTELRMKYFDTVPVATSLCVLKTGFLFTASEFGNHYLYQIAHLGDDDDEPEFSSAMELEEGTTFFFAPRGLKNLVLVDEIESLAPVMSCQIADLANEDTPQLYAACGRGPRSSMRVLRHGLEVSEMAVSELPGNPNAVWTVKTHSQDEFDSYIVVSFINATLVLSIGETVEEVTDSGFLGTTPTLSCSQLGEDALLQVYTDGIRHIRADKRVNEWKTPGKKTIVKCAVNERQVVIALTGGEIVYFEMDPSGQLNEYTERKEMSSDVQCMALGTVPTGEQRSRFLAIGLSDNTVRVISLDPQDCLQPLSMQALPATPESLCIVEMAMGGLESESGRLGGLFLNIGLSNGVLLRTVLDMVTGDLSDTRTRYLGSKAVKLFKIRMHGSDAVLAMSSRSWLSYSYQSRFHLTPLSYETLEYASSFSSEQCPEGIVAISANTLRILALEKLGAVFNQVATPLRYTPRKFVIHPRSNNLIIIESDHNAFTDTVREEKKQQIAEEMVEAAGDDEKELAAQMAAEFLNEDLAEQQFGAPKAGPGMWASLLRMLDPIKGETVDEVRLDQNESAVSVCVCNFNSRPDETYALVGTAKDLTLTPRSCAGGFIHTYKIAELIDGGYKLEFVHKTEVDDIPGALAPFQGRLLAGVGRLLRIYDLGKKKLLRKCENKKLPNFIMGLNSMGTRIVVSDIQESFHFVKYKARENHLVIFADDVNPRTVVIQPLSTRLKKTIFFKEEKRHFRSHCKDSEIGFFSFFYPQIRLSSSTSDEVDEDPTGTKAFWDRGLLNGAPQKVETLCNYHVGETVLSLQKATLIPGGSESLVYTTLSGGVGMLVPFTSREDIDFFQHLEMHLRAEQPSLCGRDHISYRSYYLPVKSVIDGDLCEYFNSLDSSKRRNIAEELDRTPAEVSKKLEDIRTRYAF
ncbi:PREDICTED: splicing factor 3B subunit 3-like [Acropora digitifera]|uniref:splicing factor 3B subunit 3-like n=1 Tax=Acropora digitifera TaxID=70779 RepID=UPI00077A88E6|nr:PREDICTED: splicing factor 3B subunit 3-like [Acropora digitifera]